MVTQTDLDMLRRNELDTGRDASRRVFPSYIVKSLRYMVSYVVAYMSNVLHSEELAMWKEILELNHAAHADSSTSRAATSEFAREDILLRMACRKAEWFALTRLEDTYADLISKLCHDDERVSSVADVVEFLRHCPVRRSHLSEPDVLVVNADTKFCEATMINFCDGSIVTNLIATKKVTQVHAILRSLRVSDLKELAWAMYRTRQLPEAPSSTRNRRSSGKLAPSADCAVGDDTMARQSSSLASFPSVPESKEALVTYITERADGDSRFPEMWDASIGPMVRVHPCVKQSLQRLLSYFHIITDYFPLDKSSGGAGKGVGASPPLPTSNIAVVATLGHIQLPMTSVLPLFRFHYEKGVDMRDPGEPRDVPSQQLLLFSTRHELDSYMAALSLQCELFDICEGFQQRHKARDAAFVASVEHRIEQAMISLDKLEKQTCTQWCVHGIATKASSCRKRPRFSSTVNGCSSLGGERRCGEGVETPPAPHAVHCGSRWLTTKGALTLYGYDAHHLLKFLPLCRWFACVEYVFEMLQSLRQYDNANRWLKVLLEHPVFEVRSVAPSFQSNPTQLPPVVLRFLYRHHARGRWWHRLGLNTLHLGREAQALGLMETALAACSEEGEDVDDMIAAQSLRFKRLMGEDVWSDDACHRFACCDVWTKKFLRRADRMTMERLLVRLHKPPRRWGALPKHLLVTSVLEAPVTYLHGKKDEVAGGWSDAALNLSGSSVEAHVLRWYCSGRGRKEAGWAGVHCEGSWFFYLAKIVLLDAFIWHPDPEVGNIHSATPSPFLWLSPFQADPLDWSCVHNFSRRRQRIIELDIHRLKGMTNEELRQLVVERTTLATATVASERGTESSDDVDDADEHACDAATFGAPSNAACDAASAFPLTASGAHQEEAAATPVFRVDISALPELLELVMHVPIAPFSRALEEMFLSPPSSGHVLRFSGFPDLVLWRNVTRAEGNEQRRSSQFLLAEVKSPNDSLSDKQVSVNDMLLRCGFDVILVAVVDESKTSVASASSGVGQLPKRPASNKKFQHKVAQLRPAPAARDSGAWVKGSVTNPVVL